jgi:5,10-methylenetetrahydromethanopterin reductase
MSNASTDVSRPSMGVGLFPTEPIGRMVELAQLAESLGYANAWFGDSQNIWRETHVMLGAAAAATSKIVLGSGVTNALTRHPSVVASGWATLSEMTSGRAVCGIGTGDSSLRTMGLKPMTLASLERVVEDLRAAWRGDSVEERSGGSSYHLEYLQEARDIPLYIAASAPKILELSGRIADGVIVLVGTDQRFIDGALAAIGKGAEAAGRSMDDIRIVLWTPTAIDEDERRAYDLVRAHVARVIIRPLPGPLDPEKLAAIEKVKAAYDYYQHMQVEAHHGDLVTDDLVDLFALAGTPDSCRARIAALKASGVDQVAIVPFVPAGGDRANTMRTFAEVFAGAATSDGNE